MRLIGCAGMSKKFKIGKTYNSKKLNFWPDSPYLDMEVIYMGIHPYAKLHVFACENGDIHMMGYDDV